jgi:hypothetical protein
VKVNAIPPHSPGERNPSLNGGFGFAKMFRDFPEGTARPTSGNHLPPLVRNITTRFCLSCGMNHKMLMNDKVEHKNHESKGCQKRFLPT